MLIAAVTLLALAAFEAVTPLQTAALTLRSALESGRRLLEIVHTPPAVADPVDARGDPDTGPLAMEGVRLEPDDAGSWGLRGVDLTLEPGERVALIGRSGSGKSRIAELLVRFLDPDAGRVAVAGTDVRHVSDARRDAMSASTRRTPTCSRPLSGRTCGSPGRARRRRARDGAAAGSPWDWVAQLPQGWDTLVGEDGTAVSGGERRRLAWLAPSWRTRPCSCSTSRPPIWTARPRRP